MEIKELSLNNLKKTKKLGQVYTPEWIVTEILDLIDYKGEKILTKKIIDPACGNGAFLKLIVKRIIEESLKEKKTALEIKTILENCVYGIEIDKEEYTKCIKNLNVIVQKEINQQLQICWKIFNENTLLKYKDFKGFFDYVVGNPPYIRIHNLDENTRKILKKNFIFSDGTIDIYISFFEVGFKLLNNKGILGYITPNSFLHNSSYKKFRKYLKNTQAIKTLIDFKSNKIFKNFSTYTAITIINFFEQKDFFEYKELISNKIKKVNIIYFTELNDNNWSFSNKEDMKFLKKLYANPNKKVRDFFEVQYGFATLRDKIFIGKVTKEKNNLALFNNHWIEKELLYKVVKGSSYKGTLSEIKYIIFPYKKVNNRFVPFSEEELKSKYPNAYNYLLKHKEELLKRDIDKNAFWYEFGRNQGLQTMYKEKIVVNPLIKENIKYYFLDKETFVYSGIFITKKNEEYDWNIVESVLKSEEFKRYIQITSKNFSNGYKSITTKQIKNFPTTIRDENILFI